MFLAVKLEDVFQGFAKEQSPAPWTKEHMMRWAASKPADETYEWESCFTCFLGQYHSEIGATLRANYTQALIMPTPYHSAHAYMHEGMGSQEAQRITEAARGKPHTFGAALERLKAAA